MHTDPASSVANSSESAERLVQRTLLGKGKRTLSAPARQAIVDLGPAAVPPLIEILVDDWLELPESPGGGFARGHAATLLADLGAVDTVDVLIDALRSSDPLSATQTGVEEALRGLVSAALDRILVAFDEEDDPDVRMSLADALSHSTDRDPRIMQALLSYLREEPDFAAGCLAEYGDPAALPALSAQLSSISTDGDSLQIAIREVIELCYAIESLDGTLTPMQEAKRAQVEALC